MENPFAGPQNAENNPFQATTEAFAAKIPGVALTEADLAAREEALKIREDRISQKENELQKAKQNGTVDDLIHHPKNFPPGLRMWKYYPKDELPDTAQSLVNTIKWIFVAACFVTLWNVLSVITLVFSDAKAVVNSPGTMIIYSTISFVLLMPVFIEISFFSLYRSIRSGSGLKFFCFLLTYALFFALFAILATGVKDWGSVGFILMFDFMGSSTLMFVMSMIFSVSASLVATAIFFTWFRAFSYYKTQGLDKKAMGEATKMAANYAMDNKEKVIEFAKENPDLAMDVAKAASAQV